MKPITWCLLLVPAVAAAQAPACTDTTFHFEYQMSTPARWLPDTAATVHPTPAVRSPPNLIQFLVDTLGVPQPRTFRAIKITDTALVLEARRTLVQWRFSPGLLNGCRVRQLVQTPIGR